MRDSFDLAIKTVNDLIMLPSSLGKLLGVNHFKSCKPSSETYGGFTNSDWKKVGNDMRRGLISFEKEARS